MKKRQVMALILAAALALPNTGVVAEIVGAPATVEAAGVSVRSAGASINFAKTPTVTESVSAVKKALQSTSDGSDGAKITKSATKVADVITVGSGWKVLNGDQELVRGNENVVEMRYTFPEGSEVTGNGWEKDGDVYYGDFKIKFEAVELVELADIISNINWPTLGEKMFAGSAATKSSYWDEDLKSGSSTMGTFSVNDDADVSGAGNVNVDVIFTLNKGYEFASADTVQGCTAAAGAKTCTKTFQNVKVTKKVVDNFEMPEMKVEEDQEIAVGNTVSDVLGLTAATGANGTVQFSIVQKDGTALGATTFKKGVNEFKIKAELASADANLEIAEEKQFKDLTVNVTAPVLDKVQIVGGAEGTDEDDYQEQDDYNGGLASAKKVTLKAVDHWTPSIADDDKTRVYGTLKYQWYKDGVEIPGATSQKYEVVTSAPDKYSCKITAEIKTDTATVDDKEWYKPYTVDSQKVNVSFTDIAKGQVGDGKFSDNSVYNNDGQYGKLQSDVKYELPLTGLTKNAEMSLVVKSGDKDVTDEVKDMISGKADPIGDDGAGKFVITVNKGIDVGTYTFYVNVKDGKNTATFNDAKLVCTVEKQEINLSSAVAGATVKALGEAPVHGDAFEKVAGFEYAGGNTTDDKNKAKEINGMLKITATEADYKAAFAAGYFTKGTQNVTVNVELAENYKKNYKITGLTPLTSPVDDKQTTTVAINPIEKKITLGIKDLDMLKGHSLPDFEITGVSDFLEADGITVEDGGWTLYDEKDQREITNGVKSLDVGNYMISVDLTVAGSGVGNYKINGLAVSANPVNVRAKLTIHASEHVVGFVTDGGNAIADRNVYHNDEIGTLETPVRSGYKFLGWFADRKYTTPVTASTKVTDDMVLYAKWEKTSSTSGGSEETPGTGSAVKVGTKVSSSSGTFSVTSVAANKKTVSYKAASKSVKSVTIPSSVKIKGVTYKVTRVANSAFSGCKNLTKVTIPSTVTSIGTSSFKNCKKLTSVTIPKNVKVIDASAFSGCSKLKSVTFKGTKIKKIGKSAFKGIAKKSVIKVPKSKKTAYKKLLKKSGYTKTVR